MNQNDIRRIYTEKVAGLLAKGYVLHPETMGGSQGEMARIDLTNEIGRASCRERV